MYQALYRKYRPAYFSDVSGQDHITSTLKNEIMLNRIAHAYLFFGTRGTGKTSCARIFAKAVNCDHPINGEPCGQCRSCTLIGANESMDVIEIDAASNTGVDNIRDIRSEVLYTPAQSKYKVYIIDEVHMLSTGAFNAFLKTLENPPEHVIFILATTEVHKIMPTILSRCQRFDFKRISVDDIHARLTYICEKENISCEPDALLKIAQIGDGSLRDSISLLDQCSAQQEKITKDTILTATGEGNDAIFSLLSPIFENDPGQALLIFSNCYARMPSVSAICSDLITLFRDMMIIKTVKDPLPLIGNDSIYFEKLSEIEKNFSIQRIMYSLDSLSDAQNKLLKMQNQRVFFEMSLIRLCNVKLALNAEALSARIGELERKLARESLPQETKPQKEMPEPEKKIQPVDSKEKVKKPAEQKVGVSETITSPSCTEEKFLKNWNDILMGEGGIKPSLRSLLIDSKAYINGGRLTVICENPMAKSLFDLSQNGKEFLLSISAAVNQPLISLNFITSEEYKKSSRPAAKNDPFEDLLMENQEYITIKD